MIYVSKKLLFFKMFFEICTKLKTNAQNIHLAVDLLKAETIMCLRLLK